MRLRSGDSLPGFPPNRGLPTPGHGLASIPPPTSIDLHVLSFARGQKGSKEGHSENVFEPPAFLAAAGSIGFSDCLTRRWITKSVAINFVKKNIIFDHIFNRFHNTVFTDL